MKAFVYKSAKLICRLSVIAFIPGGLLAFVEELTSEAFVERLIEKLHIPISYDQIFDISVATMIFMCIAYLVWARVKNSPKYGYHYAEGFEINCWQLRETDASYPLSRLTEFFSMGTEDAEQRLYLPDIHKEFPLTHLRKMRTNGYYIAYKVSEGGIFLVFLSNVLHPDGEWLLGYVKNRPSFLYIHDLPTMQDFQQLTDGVTYEEVKALAPSTQPVIVTAGVFASCSLLRNKQVVLCTYKQTKDGVLRLETQEVLQKKDSRNVFRWMVSSDLEAATGRATGDGLREP